MGCKLVFVVAGLVAFDLCAALMKVSFGEEKPIAMPTQPGASDIVKVKARGVGTNKDEALKDAYRDAVERAIGLYVDAEQMVKNGEVVQDQVLSHSNAYITHYDEVSAEQIAGGLFQVRIVADVKKQQLTKKLEGVMPPQTVKVNGGILSDAYAQLVTQEKRTGDSAALLKAALKDCDPVKSLIVANVRADSQKLLTGNQVEINYKPLPSDKVMLRYLFELKLDREKYFKELVPHLQKTLAQISLTPLKEVRLSERMQERDDVVKGEVFVRGDMDGASSVPVMGEITGGRLKDKPSFPDYLAVSGVRRSESACLWPLHEYTWSLGGEVCALPTTLSYSRWVGAKCWALDVSDRENNMKASAFQVGLVSQLNTTCASGKMSMYDLDPPLKVIVDETLKGLRRTGTGFGSDNGRMCIYDIVFADKDGNELVVEKWEVPVACLLNMCCACTAYKTGGMKEDGATWFITPFVGCFGENYLEWKSFVLDRELLKKIDTIKIELAE